jgi:hypothetical protein
LPAFSPRRQSGLKEKKTPTGSVTKLPRMIFAPFVESREEEKRNSMELDL